MLLIYSLLKKVNAIDSMVNEKPVALNFNAVSRDNDVKITSRISKPKKSTFDFYVSSQRKRFPSTKGSIWVFFGTQLFELP